MTTEHIEELNDQQLIRREKMTALAEQGIDPFGKRFERTADSAQLKEKYSDKTKEELHELAETATIAGRLMTKRGKGKVGFAHIQDREGQIQIYVRKDTVGEENYQIFKKADIGDFLGIEGEVMRTDMGELSIKATHITHLSKALRPLPEKFHGLTDVETIYRKRYLDLISNRESFERFVTRSRIVSEIRRYLDTQGFLEVETPALQENMKSTSLLKSPVSLLANDGNILTLPAAAKLTDADRYVILSLQGVILRIVTAKSVRNNQLYIGSLSDGMYSLKVYNHKKKSFMLGSFMVKRASK